jgi:hypothetical protein
MSDVGRRKLREGSEACEEVRRRLMSNGGSDEDESVLRGALVILRSAMNWLEETEQFEEAHAWLDKGGRLAREAFPAGCQFPFRDGTYYIECPVALAHNRHGLSVGFVVRKRECSICRIDPEDCPHINGRLYGGQRCISVITDADILEISVVGRPAQPDARTKSMSIGMQELRDSLGDDFVPGVPVTCDRCLSRCDGVVRPFENFELEISEEKGGGAER